MNPVLRLEKIDGVGFLINMLDFFQKSFISGSGENKMKE